VSHLSAALCQWWRALNQPPAAVRLDHAHFFSVWQQAGLEQAELGRQAWNFQEAKVHTRKIQ